MATFHLILTSDYEVWGDGSGCVENCLIDPTNSMLETADKYGAKITFFFDVCEFWAFKRMEEEGRFSGDYRPASLIKEQLQGAMSNGHDVQLHFHPQWLNYKMISNQSWELDNRYWKLPSVDNFHNDRWDIAKLFEEGIATLNELFLPINPNYKVNVFRAGGWCIQPENVILDAMKANDIKFDSTVAPGRFSVEVNNEYNFRHSLESPYWEIGESILEKGNSGVIEMPITTAQVNLAKNFIYKVAKFRNKRTLFPVGCHKNPGYKTRSALGTLSKLFESQPSMLNYSDGSSFDEMKTITLSAMRNYQSISFKEVPLVAISHSKTFGFSSELDAYLKWMKSNENVKFSTFTEFSKSLK